MNKILNYCDIFNDIETKVEYKLIFDKHHVLYINKSYYNIPLHGWKIHISSTIENSLEVFYKCSKFLIDKKINFKCLKSIDDLKYINSRNSPRCNFGKFITIYPKDSKETSKLLEELNVLLNKYDAPYILNDLRYKDCKSVYFRYGRLRILSDESEEERKYIKLKNNKIILDPRLPYFYLPPEIDWPFEFKEPESESDDSLLLKNKYEVIDAFSLSSKGGVYLAKYNEKECIIKEFRPHVYNNNWEGQQIFCNEKKIYEKLFEFDFCPKLIDSFQEWEHYFLVVEKVNGETLTNYLAKNTEIYQSKQKKDAYIDNTYNILKQVLKILKVLHSEDYVFGDMSSENFLIDNNNKVFIVDFEYCSKIFNVVNKCIGSKGFYNPRNKNNTSGKKKDIIGFGLLAMKLYSNSNFLIDLDYDLCLKNFKLAHKKLEIPDYIYEMVELCINPNFEMSVDELIKCLEIKDCTMLKIRNAINKLNRKYVNKIIDSDLDKKIIDVIFDSNTTVSDENFKSSVSVGDYSLEHGAINMLLKSIVMNKNPKIIERYINILFLNIKRKNGFNIGFQIKNSGRYSLYLYNGICGFLLTLQYIRERDQYKHIFSKYKTYYYDLLIELTNYNYYKTSFAEGISGIIFIYINEIKFSKKRTHVDNLKKLTEILLSLCIVKNNDIVFVNQNFEESDSSFSYGEIGILLTLKAVLKLL